MTYSDYRQRARDDLAGNWATAIGVTCVAALLGGLFAGGNVSLTLDLDEEIMHRLPDAILSLIATLGTIGGFLALVQFIVGGPVQLGYAQILLKQYHRQEYEMNDLFARFQDFKQGFLQYFLRGLYTALWSLLFVIPGIIAHYKYFMAPYLMADNPGMTAKEAIAASTELMDGHKGELFMLGLTFIGWDILAGLTLGIGYLWLNPYKHAAFTAFYRDLLQQRLGIEE